MTGFEFWGGGVLVAAPPEIWFLKDSDGDDHADVKIRMLQGVSSADTHHSANGVRIGPGGWMYWSRGIFNVANFETPTHTYRSGQSGVHRFNPRTFEVEFHFPIGPNPHGDVFDRWGYQFANDGTGGTGSYVNIGKGRGNKQWFKKRVRPVAATGILSSSQFPDEFQGNFLICNTIGFLGVLQHKVTYDGADIRATEIDPILVSTDPNFRPTDLEVGGDGGLYISDWHNALIGHMQHNMRDPNRDHTHGRIYRVTYKGRPLLNPPKMKGKPILEVCEHFFAKEDATRYHARLELTARAAADIVREVGAFVGQLRDQLQAADGPQRVVVEQALLECLWVFEEQRIPNLDLLKTLFAAREPRVRAAAIRTLGHWRPLIDDWEDTLLAAARDDSPLVRAEAVKAAVEFEGLTAAEVIFEVANQQLDPELEAVLAYANSQLHVDAIVQGAIRARTPLSLAARKYILNHASIDDLFQLERTEEVERAVLGRREATPEQLESALASLARRQKAGKLDVVMDLIVENSARPDGNLAGLLTLLARQPRSELRKVQDEIQKLALAGDAAATRRLAFAAWIAAAGPDDAFLAASQTRDGRRDFLDAVPLVDVKHRGELYAKVEPLVFEVPQHSERLWVSEGENLHEVAIRALVTIPDHGTEAFQALARLVKAGVHRPAAIAALAKISPDDWPPAALRPLVDNLIGYLSSMPAKFRTTESANTASKLATALATRLPADQAAQIEARLQNMDVRVIAIGTVPQRMIFDKERIAVQAGTTVEFRFSNTDAMPHNFSITEPGALQEVGELAEATGRDPDAIERNYVPKSARILLASRLLQPGEMQSLAYETPSQPGVYPYVCTYPGHWRRMYGALYVVADVNAYQADPEAYVAVHTLPIQDELLKFNTRSHQWTFEELIGEVRELPPGRSYEVGKELFKVASCVSCHQLGGEGVVFGPDLAKLDAKKHSTEYILRSVLEPSRDIDDKFRSCTFVVNGRPMTGMIVEETASEVNIVVDPLAKAKPTVLAKNDIEEQFKSDVSLMPKGVLDKLSREEILDLIAFVYAGGDKTHTLFKDHAHHP